jgi:hypothetical protein
MSLGAAPTRSHGGRATVGIVLAMAALLAVIVMAFSWPAVTAEPKNLPLAVAGPADAVTAFGAGVEKAKPGLLDITPVADRDAAVAAIEARDVYGAIVLGPKPEVLTASGAGPSVAQAVSALAAPLQSMVTAQAGTAGVEPPTVTVTDVVPLSPDDPRGTGFNAAMFPFVLGGILGGVGLSLRVRGPRRRALALVAYALVGGAAIAAIVGSWFGALPGSWWALAGAIALALAAIAATIAGLNAWLGYPGLALGAVLIMLIGNPLSGVAIPPEFIPEPWGAVGQWFPPGAGATLLRGLAYFPAADATFPWLVLAGWAVVGFGLLLAARDRTAAHAPAVPEPAAQPATAS